MGLITNSEKQTTAVAQKLAAKLQGGEVLCLVGDLGAGKTAFTKGIAKGLNVSNIVTSPTFVLMKNYKARLGQINQLVHIDAYRLDSGVELEYIGASEYFNDCQSVTIIEWADKVKDIWPKHKIVIEFKILPGNSREIKIS